MVVYSGIIVIDAGLLGIGARVFFAKNTIIFNTKAGRAAKMSLMQAFWALVPEFFS